jgi:hypothetical protein
MIAGTDSPAGATGALPAGTTLPAVPTPVSAVGTGTACPVPGTAESCSATTAAGDDLLPHPDRARQRRTPTPNLAPIVHIERIVLSNLRSKSTAPSAMADLTAAYTGGNIMLHEPQTIGK